MAFYCPECKTRSLKIVTRIELPGDSRQDLRAGESFALRL
jgi:hypothetical protein